MKVLRIIGRILVGLVFIFSGTVKAIDPLGSAYKFHDYFQAFNIGFLDPLCLPLAILLCWAEFMGGFTVLAGVKQETGIILVLILMIIFTPLTFILALTNPVSDCGCFGDAIHLTNWETFGKNVIILSAVIIVYKGRQHIRRKSGELQESIIIAAATVVFILFAFYNLRYLPVVDFLPYRTGVNIASEMTVPKGAQPDVYETTFIYEKDGVTKEFTLENYPANDTSWKFIDQKSTLIKKGYQPPIHDFSIITGAGEDITEKVLTTAGYTLLMTAIKIEEAGKKHLEAGFNLGHFCLDHDIAFYILTASGSSETNKFSNGLQFCATDETTLKTMVRSNPGYMLLHEGTIAGKWSYANCPDKEWFVKLAE
jgi:uncharacterized membrane protein YphA (DoxX/SURF4 family)